MTPEQIDKLWNRALAESVAAGEEFTRYRFAAMVESAAVRRCAEIADKLGAKGWPHAHAVDVEAKIREEFPGAFECNTSLPGITD